MAKKKQEEELEFDEYEEEDEDEDEYDEDEYDDEDEEGDEDEEPKRGLGRVLAVALIGLVIVLGGAYVWMSGGSIPALSSLPLPFLNKPTPAPVATPLLARSAYQNPQLQHGTVGALASASHAASASALLPLTASKPHPHHGAASGSVNPSAVAANPKAAHAARVASALGQAASHPSLPAIRRPPVDTAVAPKSQPEPSRGAPAVHRRTPAKVAAITKSAHRRHGRRQLRNRIAQASQRHHRRRVAAGRSGAYAVQVGAFAQAANAERLIASLKSRGYEAYSESAAAAGTTFYVRSNTVDSRSKADQLVRQFRAAGVSGRLRVSSGRYTLALGTFASQSEADGLVARLNSKGLFVSVTRATHQDAKGAPGPRRVVVGHYASRAQAETVAKRLRRKLGVAMVVRR